MIDPPRYVRPVSHLKLRFSLHMVKDDWPLRYDRPVSYLKCLKLRFSLPMVKHDWFPQVWQTSVSSKVKIQPAHGERWLTPHIWLTSSSPKILKLRFSLHMVKHDWSPWVCQTSISSKVKIQPAHGERWLTPHIWLTSRSTKILKLG